MYNQLKKPTKNSILLTVKKKTKRQKSTKERAIAGIFIWALLLLHMTMTHTVTISLKVLLALKKAHTSVHGGYQPWQKKSGSGRFDFS